MLVPAIGFFVTKFPAMVALSFEFALVPSVPTIVITILVVSATVSIFNSGQLAF